MNVLHYRNYCNSRDITFHRKNNRKENERTWFFGLTNLCPDDKLKIIEIKDRKDVPMVYSVVDTVTDEIVWTGENYQEAKRVCDGCAETWDRVYIVTESRTVYSSATLDKILNEEEI